MEWRQALQPEESAQRAYFADAPDLLLYSDHDEHFWFSHRTKEYEVRDAGTKRIFILKESQPEIKLDWDNCTVSIGELFPGGRVRFVVRSKTNRNSHYMGDRPVQLRYMLGIDVDRTAITEVRSEPYKIDADSKRSGLQSLKDQEHKRWVFDLGEKAEVWEWASKNQDMRSSRVYRLREDIRKYLDSLPPEQNDGKKNGKIFRVRVDRLDEVVPVIYQPAVDSLDNFLREVHCHTKTGDDYLDVQVTLLFNNEYLRRFWFVDEGYRWFRKLKYGRLIDVETFHIHFVRDRTDRNYFLFQNIYSGSADLEEAVHYDSGRVEHDIAYYFADQHHPIVFINTSNHAMAGHDNNHDLWKWEYIPWIENAPIKRGGKSRRQVDGEYMTIFDKLLKMLLGR